MVHPVVCHEAGLRPPQSCQGEEGQLLKAEDVKAFGAVAADLFEYERYACSNPLGLCPGRNQVLGAHMQSSEVEVSGGCRMAMHGTFFWPPAC
jgi:hypothetical protein